jgi:hypothetical protein
VTSEGAATVTQEWLQREIERHRKEDGVYQTEFLEGVVLYRPTLQSIRVDTDAREHLGSMGTHWISCLDAGFQAGPFFLDLV